jgi:hypothetical protein
LNYLSKGYQVIILCLALLFSCNEPTCPKLPAQIYLTDSLDHGNCNCRIITANVTAPEPFTLSWNHSGQTFISTPISSVQVCPATETTYGATLENETSFIETSVTVGPRTACDAKQISSCTRALIETANDLIQLYHNESNLSSVALSNLGKYEGTCNGTGMLNALYYSPTYNSYYKIAPFSLACDFLPANSDRDNIIAPTDQDFINGRPPYLNEGERVFANYVMLYRNLNHLFSIHWTKINTGFGSLGVCPPKSEFIISNTGSQYPNELYNFHFFTIKEGCSYAEAYSNLSCKNLLTYPSIKRVFNPRIDGTNCLDPSASDYELKGSNVKVTVELMDGSYTDAYFAVGSGDGNPYDGTVYFKYKEDRANYPCE